MATLVAVGFGGGMCREACKWFYGLKHRFCLPLFFMIIVMIAVFTVSGVGFFLFWRRREDYDTQYYDAIMGLHFGSLLSLFFVGNMLFNWRKLGMTTIFMLLAWAGTTVALVLLGIQKAWLPFGLYFALPVFLLYALFLSIEIWKYNGDIRKKVKKERKQVEVSSSLTNSPYAHTSHHRSKQTFDEEAAVQEW